MGEVDWQGVATFITGIMLLAVGWWCNTLWREIQTVSAGLSDVQVKLPTDYVRRTDFERELLRMERSNAEALSRIESGQKENYSRVESVLERIIKTLENKADK